MQGSPITQKEVEALMESIDVDATGSIDYDEFLAATINMSQLQVHFSAGRPGLNPLTPIQPIKLSLRLECSEYVPPVECFAALQQTGRSSLSAALLMFKQRWTCTTPLPPLSHQRTACTDGGEHVPRLPAL